MLTNTRSFAVTSAPVALSELHIRREAAANVFAAILQDDDRGRTVSTYNPCATSPDLVHWDDWAEKVRDEYTMPLKRYTRRLALLFATLERSRPLASTVLVSSALGLAFIIHLVLHQFTN